MDNLITQAIEQVGLGKLAAACGVTYQALRKWEKARRLPRTDWTGETNYASDIARATRNRISRAELRAWSERAYLTSRDESAHDERGASDHELQEAA